MTSGSTTTIDRPRLFGRGRALRLVDELFASPYLTLRRATDATGATAKNAQNVIDKFVAAGLLREMTGKQRNRVDCADQILHLIDQPMNVTAPTP